MGNTSRPELSGKIRSNFTTLPFQKQALATAQLDFFAAVYIIKSKIPLCEVLL
jgi:hypothetical protein